MNNKTILLNSAFVPEKRLFFINYSPLLNNASAAFINYVVPLNKSLFVITRQFSFSFWFENERYNNMLLYTNKNTQIKTLREKQCLVTCNNIITSLYHYFYQ